MKKRALLPTRLTAMITPADELQHGNLLTQSRAVFPATPVLTDDEFKEFEMVGPTKQKEIEDKAPILVEHSSFIRAPLNIEVVVKNTSLADAADRAADKLEAQAADLRHLAAIARGEAYNMLKCCEDEAETLAGRKDEAAILANNKLQELKAKTKVAKTAAENKVAKRVAKKAEKKTLLPTK
jgi:hypothetical protein